MRTYDTFECVQPEALIVLLLTTGVTDAIRSDAMRTLDCGGWLDQGGKPDLLMARREVQRHQEALGAKFGEERTTGDTPTDG